LSAAVLIVAGLGAEVIEVEDMTQEAREHEAEDRTAAAGTVMVL